MHRTAENILCLQVKQIIRVERHDLIRTMGILKHLVMKIGCTCAFTDEGMNGFISASGKGDLLRQVILQQSNIDYLPIPRKRSGKMERTPIYVGLYHIMQSINQSNKQFTLFFI